jgi:hypothetical protein
MENAVRRKLENGETVMGMMHFTGSPMILEVMAAGGLDFAIIDMEHSPVDLGTAAHLVRTADAAGLTPFLRVPDVDAGLIKKTLNLGVRGIVIPHATVDSCKAAVEACFYPPRGDRGSCPAVRSAGYGQADWDLHMRQANEVGRLDGGLVTLKEDARLRVAEVEHDHGEPVRLRLSGRTACAETAATATATPAPAAFGGRRPTVVLRIRQLLRRRLVVLLVAGEDECGGRGERHERGGDE